MPVTEKPSSQEPLYQRAQYAKGGLGRRYWDYRDKVALSALGESDRVIVDLGCGEGITLEKVVGMFPASEVIGIDYLEENVDICRRHGLPAAEGSIYDTGLAARSVDAVLVLEVIEHLDRPEAALGEIARILRPGGKLVLLFPNDRVFKIARYLTLRFKEARYDPGHVRQWTPRAAREALRSHGFEVCSARSIPFVTWALSLHHVVVGRKAGCAAIA